MKAALLGRLQQPEPVQALQRTYVRVDAMSGRTGITICDHGR